MKKIVFLFILLCFNKLGYSQNTSLTSAVNLCNISQNRGGYELLSTCTNNDWYYFTFSINQTVNLELICGDGNQYQYELYGNFPLFTSLAIKQTAISGNTNLFSSGNISQTTLNGINFQPGEYVLRIRGIICPNVYKVFLRGSLYCPPSSEDCPTCITSFSPESGKYIVSAWVKEDDAPVGTVNYMNSKITVSYNGTTITTEDVFPSGQIIDGWQRMEGEIEIPAGTTDITITLTNTQNGGISYFDDIRFFPFDGSMMSYVYDPETLRLVAELDERNYAKFYEYDEEGKLIRVKKETERGVMTIQENRNNIKK